MELFTIEGFKKDTLCHHGVKGQKWGVKNGPPYPLNPKGQYKKVLQLNDEMNTKWDYGVLHNGKKITDLSSFDYGKDYRTTPISVLQKEKIGTCWDFVNYQHSIFKANGYPDKTYMYVTQKDNGEIQTHSFSVVDIGDKKYWVESAKWDDHGVHEVNSFKDVVDHFTDSKYGGKLYDVYEFNPDGMDNGLTDREYFDKATQNLIYTTSRRD